MGCKVTFFIGSACMWQFFSQKSAIFAPPKIYVMKPFTKKSFLFHFLLLVPLVTLSQNDGTLRIAFWNLENFFDTSVDSTRSYNEYTESGAQHWTKKRFYAKRNNLYKTVLALSEGRALGVLGVAEVENETVLASLFNATPLRRFGYRIVHYESPDRRGIDVALVYDISRLRLLSSRPIAVRDPENAKFRTRDILYVVLAASNGDTLHVFVNHWPSRYGGEAETIRLRCLAASTLRKVVDSIAGCAASPPKIIIMGDLNDTPEDKSVASVLDAKPPSFGQNDGFCLVNLFRQNDKKGFDGTLKHEYTWQVFDHIIISNTLIDSKNGLRYKKGSAQIFHAAFLFEEDKTRGGVKLHRTFVGPRYFGGYSDHLPVFIDLE